jgi:AcrR family transcriptional regulator
MARKSETARPPRKPLTRERVLRAAMRLADESGIESLSMRKLARALGVEAMSLYNHVANKDEILSGVLELVADEIDLPAEDVEWKTAIRRSAISAREAYLRHPWASRLQMSRPSAGAAQLRRADWLLRTLRQAGLSKELLYHGYHVLEAYLLGATVQQLEFPYKGEELASLAATFLQQIPAAEYPDLVLHVEDHLDPPHSDKSGFELGLDLILDGLERAQEAVAR